MKYQKIKEMLKFLSNVRKKYPILIFYIISNVINAILLRLFTTGSFTIRALLFDLGIVSLFAAFSFLIKKNGKKFYYILTSIFLIAICVINSIYYNYYSSFASASLLATSMFVGQVGDAVVKFAIKYKDWVYLWELIVLVILVVKYSGIEENVKRNFSKFLVVAVSILAIGSAIPPYYAWSRFIKLWNRVSVVNSFGVYTYQLDDIVQSLKPKVNNLFGYDNALKDVTDFYEKNMIKKSNNEYTNIFKGKNVIVIHAESLQNFNLYSSFNGEEVTPNINKLASEGIYFDNFYAQVGVGTSSDTEFTFSSSLLPSNNGTVFVNYYNNLYITIQKLMAEEGYYVFSMHGNVGDFWNRNTMHSNMGYEKFYSKSSYDIDEEYGLGLSDVSFFRQSIEILKEIAAQDRPYYGTLITLTNHTPWKNGDILSDIDLTKTVSIDGKLVTRDYLEGTTIGKYIKSVNYMDMAIGEFIEALEENGLLENTVLVIYGDHDARISKKNYDYMYNYNPYTDEMYDEGEDGAVEFNDYDYELNRKVPLIIWTKEMTEGKRISVPMGMVDAMPTLGNMLGVYNEFALGHDIMNITNGENLVVFRDGSYLTDKIYYSAKNEEAYILGNGIISEDYMSEMGKEANKLLDISNEIIFYDLLKELK